ncbi:pentaheme c-type cytochrome TorC [Pasteurellaceae bacterium TAE3-ERU1]|nr:pentaheme c-type cytochrome TorC [Pasteurellaceae bacterium TAE3-ERU1]
MKKLFIIIKQVFSRPPAKIGLGVLVLVGFIAGAISWQLFNDVMDKTSTEEFCVSCHSMQKPLAELKETAHWSNAKGVTATCSSCHLPHDKTAKYARKVQASREVFAELTGKFDDPEAFEKHRLEMAEREWARFKANGSKECKACHQYARMDFDKMSPAAQKAMKGAAERDQSCVDCHKGVAHHLPQKTTAQVDNSSKFDDLVVHSLSEGNVYYTKSSLPLFASSALEQRIGDIESAVPVKLVKTEKNAYLIELDMWRKNKGFGRVWYHQFGVNITDAVLDKDFMQSKPHFDVVSSKGDPLTGLDWQQVQMQVWIKENSLISDIDAIWKDAESVYKTQCSTCHRQPDIAHFDANSWIGLFNGMVGFTNMDEQTSKEVLRYLQLHSSDFQEHK